jgi:4-hydroxybenzoate polyprenyltransferase
VHYDTIYACQDREDDILVGVKSAALILGDHVLTFTAACSVLFLSSLYYAGYLNEQTPIFFIVSVGGTAIHLLYQYVKLDLGVPETCDGNYIPPCFSSVDEINIVTRVVCSKWAHGLYYMGGTLA